MGKLIDKWKSCPKAKSNILYGIIVSLLGCVAFWTITRHKIVQRINDELKIFTPKELKDAAWILNGVLKGVGAALLIKGLIDLKKCR